MINYNNKGWLWTRPILSALTAIFMLFDGVVHVESFKQLGYPLSVIVPSAIVELICVILYMILRTSILGAILLTGIWAGLSTVMCVLATHSFPTSYFRFMSTYCSGEGFTYAMADCVR